MDLYRVNVGEMGHFLLSSYEIWENIGFTSEKSKRKNTKCCFLALKKGHS
jgi:hypothetical protein